MSLRIGINGYGRIGRNVLRALHERPDLSDMRIVAVNDLGDVDTSALLTRHDTVHGRFPAEVRTEGDDLVIDGQHVRVLAERDPARLPWDELGVDLVIESTGHFADRAAAQAHRQAGAPRVLISAPAGEDVPTIVYGVNHDTLTAQDTIVSNASCTTNCLAPILHVLHDALGIEHGFMNTVHAYTNDQVLIDMQHDKLRRARAAAQNMIPTTSGATAAVARVLPALAGKLSGFAVRVPTVNVSFVDLTLQVERATTAEQVNSMLEQGGQAMPAGVLQCTNEPLVSGDYNHDPASSTIDMPLTRVLGQRLVKVCAWYDNEWGFSNRMLDTARVMLALR